MDNKKAPIARAVVAAEVLPRSNCRQCYNNLSTEKSNWQQKIFSKYIKHILTFCNKSGIFTVQ